MVSMHNFDCLLRAADILLKEADNPSDAKDSSLNCSDGSTFTRLLDKQVEIKERSYSHRIKGLDGKPLPAPEGRSSKKFSLHSRVKSSSPPNAEKMTLDQVKNLPDKKLLELFSEYICNEMKKKYSFQCHIIPDECSQYYESFASEMKAKKSMITHLRDHLKDFENKGFSTSMQPSFYAFKRHIDSKKRVKTELSPSSNCDDFPFDEPTLPKSKQSLNKQPSKKKNFTNLLTKDQVEDPFEKVFIPLQKETFDIPTEENHGSHSFSKDNPSCSSEDISSQLIEKPPNTWENLKGEVSPFDSPDLYLDSWMHDHDYSKYFNAKNESVDKVEWSEEDVETLESFEKDILELKSKPPQTISTPSFPNVYQPNLEIASIYEITSQDNLLSAEEKDRKVESPIALDSHKPKKRGRRRKYFAQENLKYVSDDEDGENIPSYLDTELPKMSPSEESKFAMKCINALRSKKKDDRSPVKCKICPNKTYTATATLLSHYRSHHAGIKPYKCDQCSALFTRQHSLKYHIMIHDQLCRFKCMTCGKEFRHPSHYKEHLRRHTGETPYHCEDCNRKFKTRNTYKRHMLRSHNKKLTYKNSIETISQEEVDRLLKPKKKS